LAYLDDEQGLVEAARAISALTHHNPDNGNACMLWCCAIRHAILTGDLDARVGLKHLDAAERSRWSALLDAAEQSRPADFTKNGWVVEALQGAWSAVATTPVPEEDPACRLAQQRCFRLVADQVDLDEPRPPSSQSAQVRIGIWDLSRDPGLVWLRPTRGRLRSEPGGGR
jgi:ADP-ribosyl-[dinitrogen reductase] hydrolase